MVFNDGLSEYRTKCPGAGARGGAWAIEQTRGWGDRARGSMGERQTRGRGEGAQVIARSHASGVTTRQSWFTFCYIHNNPVAK